MNSPAISRCLEKKKMISHDGRFLQVSVYLYRYFQNTCIHHNSDVLPASRDSRFFFLIKDRFHVDYKKYPQAPQGRLPQNVINPQLTRIFHTDVISTSDVKLSIYSYLTK